MRIRCRKKLGRRAGALSAASVPASVPAAALYRKARIVQIGMPRPKCEAIRYSEGRPSGCRNEAVKVLKLTEYQKALVCLECRDLLRAGSQAVTVNWKSDAARNTKSGATEW